MLLMQAILVMMMLSALGLTWRRAWQQLIPVPEAFAWSLVWLTAITLVLIPEIATRIARIFGIGRGVDMVLYGSVALLFLLVFRLFIQHERLERMLTELVQRDALRDLDKSPDA